MDSWHTIHSDADIQVLMDTYGYFHDSCIISCTYESGNYLTETLAMGMGEPEKHILLLRIDRQALPSRNELRFCGLRQCNIGGYSPNAFCDIFGAKVCFYEGLSDELPGRAILWSNDEDFDPTANRPLVQDAAPTYIIAEDMAWRLLEDNP